MDPQLIWGSSPTSGEEFMHLAQGAALYLIQ